MAADLYDRGRMIFELPSDVQMAIKIKAVKSNMTTGAVVTEVVKKSLGKYVEEARAAIAESRESEKPGRHKS
jgi:hypothetical protein